MEDFIETFIHPGGKNFDGTELTWEKARSDAECIALFDSEAANSCGTFPASRLNFRFHGIKGVVLCILYAVSKNLAGASPVSPGDTSDVLWLGMDADLKPDPDSPYEHRDPGRYLPEYWNTKVMFPDNENADEKPKQNDQYFKLAQYFDRVDIPENRSVTIEQPIPVPNLAGTLSFLVASDKIMVQQIEDCVIREVPSGNNVAQYDKGLSNKGIHKFNQHVSILGSEAHDKFRNELKAYYEHFILFQNPLPCYFPLPANRNGTIAYKAQLYTRSNHHPDITLTTVNFSLKVISFSPICLEFGINMGSTHRYVSDPGPLGPSGPYVHDRDRYLCSDEYHHVEYQHTIDSDEITGKFVSVGLCQSLALFGDLSQKDLKDLFQCGYLTSKGEEIMTEVSGSWDGDQCHIRIPIRNSGATRFFIVPQDNRDKKIIFSVKFDLYRPNGSNLADEQESTTRRAAKKTVDHARKSRLIGQKKVEFRDDQNGTVIYRRSRYIGFSDIKDEL